jgi:hypothetical protein
MVKKGSGPWPEGKIGFIDFLWITAEANSNFKYSSLYREEKNI